MTPAGGTVVAIAGAMSAALCEMACIHTIDARSDAADADDAVEAITDLRADLAGQRRRLLALAEQDATLVDELFGSGSDAASDGDHVAGDSSDDTTPVSDSDRLAKRAAGIPLATAEAALAVLEDAAVVIERGRESVAADARAGAYLADAAVQASLATVRTNMAAMDDASYAAELGDRSDDVATTAAKLRRDVLSTPMGDRFED